MRFAVGLVGLMVLALAPTRPIDAQAGIAAGSFACHFAMIPMRDGVRLNTAVCEPKAPHGALPILITRTPYGIAADTTVAADYRFLAADGYVFVYQDNRGRFGSEGQFYMNRPLHSPSEPKGTDESTDTHDTVDWLLKNVKNNNGRVGVLGVSYPGFLATMAGVNPHPAVKAISPQAPMTDTWMGDDFFHQGAFRLSYGFEYAGSMELSKDQSIPLPIGRWDTYDWYLELGPLSNVDQKYFHNKVPTWEAFVAHPSYDAFWQTRALERTLKSPAVPTLTVGGWWDQEDRFGPLATYKALEPGDTRHWNSLVMGPWNHGGWRNPARAMPVVDPGTSDGYLRDVEAPWFAFWLHDKGKLTQAEAYLYDAGAKQWRSFTQWPPASTSTPRKLYLHAGGVLSFDAPKSGEAQFDQYVSDPAHPVPYRPRPVEQTYDPRGSNWRTWETRDQRFVQDRTDVLSWTSTPLASDVTIAGDVIAHLVASTTGQDADWVTKLIDVFPDSISDNWPLGGYQLMVVHEIMRGRYRKSFSAPEALTPNTPLDFTVDLHQQSYTFKKGHRMMVQVQSSWFPLYDRNPQTWVPNIFQAKAADFKAQTHRVYHAPDKASYVSVGVLK
ncbi:MAG: CocE/NonD family hydrolase [bacterium]